MPENSAGTDTTTAAGKLELYKSDDGRVQLEVRTADDTAWLTRQQMATLFGRDVKTIGKHVVNAQREELTDMPVVTKFATTACDGKTYQAKHYSLDMVLSLGKRCSAALTLMVSMSDPKEKDIMIALITRMIGKEPSDEQDG